MRRRLQFSFKMLLAVFVTACLAMGVARRHVVNFVKADPVAVS